MSSDKRSAEISCGGGNVARGAADHLGRLAARWRSVLMRRAPRDKSDQNIRLHDFHQRKRGVAIVRDVLRGGLDRPYSAPAGVTCASGGPPNGGRAGVPTTLQSTRLRVPRRHGGPF
jgi:hypothetical protein